LAGDHCGGDMMMMMIAVLLLRLFVMLRQSDQARW
jgi:hypothetical protein